MSAYANRCPSCGAERPGSTQEGLCPRCLMNRAMTGDTPRPADVDATTARFATGSGHSTEPTPADAEATEAHISGTAASLPPSPADAAGDWTIGPDEATRTRVGNGDTRDRPHDATVRYFGDYELLSEIARGGMGIVYKARQVSLNRSVAIKMILAGNLAGEADIRRFHQEAEAAANLDHPGIVPIYEIGQHEGQHYYSMGFVEGQSLAHKLIDGPLPPRAAASLMIPIAQAVQYAHEKGVIHRDLKPGNVLLDAQGRPRVTDFGLAKQLQSDSGLTSTGQIMGTPSYMPPEQAQGHTDIGPLADVYSLGAVLYCLLTGRPPFQAANALDTLKQVLETDPPAPQTLNPAIPLDLETIALKCLQKEPHRRYGSARELAEDLNRYLSGEPIRGRPVGRLEKAAKWSRRHKAVATLLATLATVLTVGFSIMAVLWSRAERNAQLAQTLATKEAKARGEAMTLAGQEKRARAEAEEQKRLAVDKAEELAREDYVNRVSRAYRELQQDNIRLAEDLLHGCPPGRRGWEWHYVKRLAHLDSLTLEGGAESVEAIAFSPDGKWVVTGAGPALYQGPPVEPIVRAWDTASGTLRRTYKGMARGMVTGLAVSPDGSKIAACGVASHAGAAGIWGYRFAGQTQAIGRAHVILWDASTGAVLLDLSEPAVRADQGGQAAMSATFTPDGQSLVVGYGVYSGQDRGFVKVWDLATGRESFRLPGPLGGVMKLAIHPDGKRLALTGSDVVDIWDLPSRTRQGELHGPKKWVYCVAFSPDGKRLAAGGWDRTIRLWDAQNYGLERVLYGHEGFVTSLAFSPDSTRIVSTSEDRSVRIWDSSTGRLAATVHGHGTFAQTVSFRPDGRQFATGGNDGLIRIWDLRTCTPVVFEGHRTWVGNLAVRRDGARVFSEAGQFRTPDDSTQVWDPTTGEADAKLAGVDRAALAADFVSGAPVNSLVATSQDGQLVAETVRESELGFGRETVAIRERVGGRIRFTLAGHSGGIICLAFSPDGHRLVTASGDRTIKLWDTATGREVFTLLGHTAGVISLAFSPDGNRIISGSMDATARVWDGTPLPSNVLAEHDARYRKKIETGLELNSPNARYLRALSLAKSGRPEVVAEAIADIADLTKLPNWGPGQWYNFACIYSIAGGKIAEKKREFSDQAMAMLQKAVKGGFNDAAWIKQDTDLDPLRIREDFKKLIEELEKPSPAKPAK